jgi:Protein of unknown function (DUF2845)
MRRPGGILFLAGVLLSALSHSAAVSAASMWCGSDIVNVGDPEFVVLQKCGPPTYKNGDQWIYDRGPGNFLKIVVFGLGKVLYIKEDMPFT